MYQNQVGQVKKEVEIRRKIENTRREMENKMARLDTEIRKLNELKAKKQSVFNKKLAKGTPNCRRLIVSSKTDFIFRN